jgi:hypothetical protein
MKKSFELSNKKKLLIAFTILTIAGATLVASFPAVLAIGNNPVGNTIEILQSILTSVTTTESNLNNVKIEQVIEGTVSVLDQNPQFTLNCSQPWDLMAIYVSTQGVQIAPDNYFEYLKFGTYHYGSRQLLPPDVPEITVAYGSDVENFGIFPSDMTENGQSIIPVPANVTLKAGFSNLAYSLLEGYEGFSVSFKVVIQRPLDPDFTYNVVFG